MAEAQRRARRDDASAATSPPIGTCPAPAATPTTGSSWPSRATPLRLPRRHRPGAAHHPGGGPGAHDARRHLAARLAARARGGRDERRPDRAGQPPPAHGRSRAPRRPRRRRPGRAAALRPRRLQELQRRLRPPRRRRAAHAPGPGARPQRPAATGAPIASGATSSASSPTPAARAQVELLAPAALVEHGDGFAVTASYGAVAIPEEAHDRRARRCSSPTSACTRTRTPAARRPSARAPTSSCAPWPSAIPASRAISAAWPQLAEAVGRHLGLEGEALDHVRVAAELHDVGKVAIPDAILNKPGPLDDDEWAFMRRHTLIGERIVAAAPALGAGRQAGARQPRALGRRRLPRRARRARTSRSAPASSPSATPTTRSSPTAPTAAGAAPPRRWPSCSAAPARSSTRRWSRPSPPCSRPSGRADAAAAA